MDVKAVLISAFPGCGKTYFYNKYKDVYKILDSDSSEFSWIKDSEGNNTKERNPEFPQNYIDHIKENLDTADIIFISSHKVVRDALAEAKIKFLLVYPHKALKNIWISRFRRRGSNEKFIEFISNNWKDFIYEIEHDQNEFATLYKILLGDNYLDDLIKLPTK